MSTEEMKTDEPNVEGVESVPSDKPTEEPVEKSPELAPVPDSFREALNAATETISKLTAKIEKITEKHEAEIASLKAKLPSVTINEKAEIQGYFDFDTGANKLINEEAISDYERAKADFAVLSTIFK